jgi:hypothetical protein
MFQILSSGNSYLGFARTSPIWGLASLLSIEHNHGASWPSDIVGTPDFGYEDVNSSILTTKYFDKNCQALINGLSDQYREVFIGFTTNEDDFQFNTLELLDNSVIAGGDGILYLNYVNEYWCEIENLSPYYYERINTDDPTKKFYVFNYTNNNITTAFKIRMKNTVELPFYNLACQLYYVTEGSTVRNFLNHNLKQTINVLGEVIISGLMDPDSPDYSSGLGGNEPDNYTLHNYDSTQKSLFLESTTRFYVCDMAGNVLISNMSYCSPDIDPYGPVLYDTAKEKYLLLSYVSAYTGETLFVKVDVGTPSLKEWSIWNESLPFVSTVPVDDSNPPSLDITYLKNTLIKKSIFDVQGMSRILPNEVSFILEMKNTTQRDAFAALLGPSAIVELELNGPPASHTGTVKSNVAALSTFVPLQDGHTLVIGDTIVIDTVTYWVSDAVYTQGSAGITLLIGLYSPILIGTILSSSLTTVNAVITYASTTDMDLALEYGFDTVMLNKNVDSTGPNSPTTGIYRRLFICYQPLDSDGQQLGSPTNTVGNIFNPTTFDYNIGTLIYLANKIPIYRQWVTNQEQFKILI